MENFRSEDLQNIVKKISGVCGVVSDATRLYHDLSICGDDAVELLREVNQKFGTTFEEFEFYSYFPDETQAFILNICRLFGYVSRKNYFTFGHLVQVVKAGRWFEPLPPVS
jgi:hypothetical protein